MGFCTTTGTKIGDIDDPELRMAFILRCFIEFGSFRAAQDTA